VREGLVIQEIQAPEYFGIDPALRYTRNDDRCAGCARARRCQAPRQHRPLCGERPSVAPVGPRLPPLRQGGPRDRGPARGRSGHREV